MEPVRLVIWDLDDTFWRGTLTEGGIRDYREDAHALVITLARRGILSSICSKNDIAPVQTILQARGLWDYFVFPSIDWQPKAHRVARIIESMQLRAASVLFIDDNPSNLAQAQERSPGLQIANETIIERLLEDPRLVGKDDRDLSRLAQYRLLEARQRDQGAQGGDATAFLRKSDIRVRIETDVMQHLDRAIELINRTNQLNFTKQRLSPETDAARAELRALLEQFDTVAGLVHVKDRYGDYGFCGIYVIGGHWGFRRLLHYAFSCRTLGMGVEQFVYRRLGRPPLELIGETASGLDDAEDWVRLASEQDEPEQGPAPNAPRFGELRLRGGCDLEILADYLRPDTTAVKAELVRWKDLQVIRCDHSSLLQFALSDPPAPMLAALTEIGLDLPETDTGLMAPVGEGDILILSNLGDVVVPAYRHKRLGFTIPLDLIEMCHLDITQVDADTVEATCERCQLSDDRRLRLRQMVACVKRDYEFAGRIGETTIEANLLSIFAHLPHGARLFFLLPSDTAFHDGEPVVHAEISGLRRAVSRAAARFPAVKIVDLREIVTDASRIRGALGHYDRSVYLAARDRIVAQRQERSSFSEEKEAKRL